MVIGALNSGISLRYVECGKRLATDDDYLHAVCADLDEVRGKLRALD